MFRLSKSFALCLLITLLACEEVMTHTTKPEEDKKRLNRLALEKSPYLVQHACNPVDWYPWGEEAFKKAKSEDKPIFLSIGYSACHWCHVMEEESFEDPETARLMNEAFVCIKVDREERPDIDHVYMTACQVMTGGGGWPLTIIMTPDKKPFFAATYIPKESVFGRIGMLELIPRVTEAWEEQRDDLVRSAGRIVDILGEAGRGSGGTAPGREALDKAYEELALSFDERNGGFGPAPKFPRPHAVLFLLRYWKRTGSEKALAMAEKTLQAMRLGGIYDHVGFGFHRYAVDAEWLTPHFEKMLYDQALLAMAYTEAYLAAGKDEYANTAREIFSYVLRDMTAAEGAFYSAEDADSEGEEGRYYLWTIDEIEQALGSEEAEEAAALFNVKKEDSIIHLDKMPAGARARSLEDARQKLFAFRNKRTRPRKDDKILADWNGLMISALARGAQALDEPELAEAARRAADFVLEKMRSPGGRLIHSFRDGRTGESAFADDYAFLIQGLLDLYEATFDTRCLRAALDLNRHMDEHFRDMEEGGFFITADDGGELPVRPKEISDGAVPSANSVAMLNMLRLSRMTGNARFEEAADRIGGAGSRLIGASPAAHSAFLVALDFGIGPSVEVVITGDIKAVDTISMIRALRRRYLPNKVVLFRPSGEKRSGIMDLAPFTETLSPLDGKATAYVCTDHKCSLPATSTDALLELLDRDR